MKAFCICLALLMAAGTASAQMYRWVDQDGKVRYGDTPPPGAKTSSIKAPPPAANAAPAAGAKDAKKSKGPMTAAEREQDYRKRQEESRKAAEKTALETQEKSDRAENCQRAKEGLRTLESGGRVASTSASGERIYLDEAQVAAEISRTRRVVEQACK